MSQRYQKAYTIPEGFPALLKAFAREVLRSQPENIYYYGARYFAAMVDERAQSNAMAEADYYSQQQKSPLDMNMAELQEYILSIFLDHDADQSGYLDHKEFRALMRHTQLGLSKKEIERIMADADENDDGYIEYKEFVPLMVDIIGAQQAKALAHEAKAEDEANAREEVEMLLLHGLSREDLEAVMKRAFARADKDSSGLLDRKEFRACLKNSELGLTRREINMLMAYADEDHDGKISYDEFVPICFNILVERFKEDIMVSNAAQSTDGLLQAMLQEFAAADTDQLGVLPIGEVKRTLQRMSTEFLGLSRLQITSIMSEADPEQDTHLVKYAKFAATAAKMIYTMVDLASQAKRIAAMTKLADTEGARWLHGMDPSAMRELLETAFLSVDVNGTGVLERMEAVKLLMAIDSGKAFTKKQIMGIMTAIDANEDGVIDWRELIEFVFEMMDHMDREEYVQEVAFETMWQGIPDDAPWDGGAEGDADADADGAGEGDTIGYETEAPDLAVEGQGYELGAEEGEPEEGDLPQE